MSGGESEFDRTAINVIRKLPGLRSAGHIHHQNRGTPVRLAATEGAILKKKYNIVLDEAR